MLKITRCNEFGIGFKKSKVKVCSKSMVDRGKVTSQKSSTKRKNQANIAKSKNLVRPKNNDFSLNSKNMETGLDFFISGARLAFIKLTQTFIEIPILHHFDLKYHIQIETNISSYAICEILSQLTANNLA